LVLSFPRGSCDKKKNPHAPISSSDTSVLRSALGRKSRINDFFFPFRLDCKIAPKKKIITPGAALGQKINPTLAWIPSRPQTPYPRACRATLLATGGDDSPSIHNGQDLIYLAGKNQKKKKPALPLDIQPKLPCYASLQKQQTSHFLHQRQIDQ
jgi:hypothetical protein